MSRFDPNLLAYREDGKRRIESVDTMVVGDQSTAGSFTHTRFDGVEIDYDYPTVSPFAVQGDPSETVDITIGDLADPNLAPMAAWTMSDLTLLEPLTVIHDFALNAGESESLTVEESQKTTVNGFSLDLQLTAQGETVEEPTTLLNMAGALQLIRQAEGTAALQITTTEDSYTLTSVQSLTDTHTIQVLMEDGLLSFIVDEEREEIQLREEVLSYLADASYVITAPADHQLESTNLVFESPVASPVTEGYASDETGLHNINSVGVNLIADAPMGVGSSYLADEDGYLEVTRSAATSPVDGLGFRVDIKVPNALNITGPETLIDLDGAMRLEYAPDGRLRLSVTTDNGTQTLTSSASTETPTGPVNPDSYGDGTLSPLRWHTVAARVLGDELTLYVDGNVDTLTISGTLEYGTSSRYQLLAGAQAIQYNSFRLYDWSKESLLRFSDTGTAQKNVLLDGFGRSLESIESLGHLNDQQTDSAITTLRVAILSGEARDYVTLVSSDYFQEINGYYIEHLAEGLPAIQDDGTLGSLPMQMMIGAVDFVIPAAQAGIFSTAWSVFNFIIPIEDVGILFQQLYYLAFDRAKFDANELVFASLGTLTIIPLAKPLKPLLPGLKRLVKIGSSVRPSFYTAAGGALGKTVKAAFRGKTGELIQWLPMLYVMGEMVVDQESRESLVFMLNTISSENDLLAWVRYLALPTNGWEGAVAPILSSDSESEEQSVNKQPSDFFFSTANANTSRALRVGKTRVNDLLSNIARNPRFKGSVDEVDFKALISAVDSIPDALLSARKGFPRAVAHTPELLNAAARGLKNFTQNYHKLRINPVIMTGILSYLYTRQDCADESDQVGIFANCKEFNATLSKKIEQELSKILSKMVVLPANGKTSRGETLQTSRLHGDVFQLAVLAQKQFEYELGISNKDLRPVNVQYKRLDHKIMVFKPKNPGRNIKYLPFTRIVDIVLCNDNGDPNTEGDTICNVTGISPNKNSQEPDPIDVVQYDRLWIEVKSYLGSSANSVGKLSKNKLLKNSKSAIPQKEWILDCKATTINPAIGQKAEADIEWVLQKFYDRGTPRRELSPDSTQIKKFRDRTSDRPTHNGVQIPADTVDNNGKVDRVCPDKMDSDLRSTRNSAELFYENALNIAFYGIVQAGVEP